MSNATGTASGLADLFAKVFGFLTSTGHAFGKTFTGTGNGDLINYVGKSATVAQTLTITATSSTSFTVVGSVSGAMGTATVGTTFSHAQCDFKITAGGTAYVSGDVWRLNLSPKWPINRAIQGVRRADRTGTVFANPADLIGETPSNTPSQVPTGSLPGTLQAKFVVSADVREIAIVPGSYPPSAFTVDYSDDGSSWTTASSFSGLSSGWAYSVARRFAVTSSGSHPYWRIRVTASTNGTYCDLCGLQFYDAVGANAALSSLPWFSVQVPGNDGAQPATHLKMQAGDFTTADVFGLLLSAHTSFAAAQNFDNQPGTPGQGWVGMAASDSAMPYWIVANGRRFALVVKVSTTYHTLYGGLILPYARPSQYPLPLALGGSSSGPYSARWSDVSTGTRHYWSPGPTGRHCLIRDIGGTWQTFKNVSGNYPSIGADAGPYRIFPSWSSDGGLGESAIRNTIRENIDGSYPLLPVAAFVTNYGPLGEFEGIFWTSGFGNASENVHRLKSFDHVAFQNVAQTGAGDYFALRMD